MSTATTRLLEDAFRRADKNDNGSLSHEEFNKYFADDVVSKEELDTLFKQIDNDGNGELSSAELAAYFAGKMDAFDGALTHTEALSASMQGILSKCHAADASTMDHFDVRFLAGELANHVDKISEVLNGAQAYMLKTALAARSGVVPHHEVMETEEVHPVTAPSRSMSAAEQLAGGAEHSDLLASQVDRLAVLLDRLGGKAKLGSLPCSKGKGVASAVIVRYSMKVLDAEGERFGASLQTYTAATNRIEQCLHVRVLHDESDVELFEIWLTEESLAAHRRSDAYRAFQHSNVETLEEPVAYTSMPTPVDWWL